MVLQLYCVEEGGRVLEDRRTSFAFISIEKWTKINTFLSLLLSVISRNICILHECLPKHSNILFADDVKIYYTYKQLQQADSLQQDLSPASEWCESNDLHLNMKKSSIMTLSRKNAMKCTFSLAFCSLLHVDSVKNLEVTTFDTELNFSAYVFLITNKANSLLVFIKRWDKLFNNKVTAKILYISINRPTLEHASAV